MRKHALWIIIVCLVATLIANASLAQQPANDGKWRYRLTPYIWMSGIDGTVGAADTSTNVDASFWDLAKHLDIGFQVHFEAQKGRLGFFVDPTYMKLSADTSVEGSSANLDLTEWMVEFGGIYQLWAKSGCNGSGDSSIDFLIGGRYWNINSDISVQDVGSASADEDWVNPFVGARYITKLSRQWELYTRFDVAFGPDSSWNALLGLGYRTSESGQWFIAYRALSVDHEHGSGDDFFKMDVTFAGPGIGYEFDF